MSSVSFTSPQSRINDRAMWAIFLLCGLLPIGLGANRPLVWLICAVSISICMLVYCIALWRKGQDFRRPLNSMPLIAILFAIFVGFIFVQMLPLGQWASPLHLAVQGTFVTGQTLSLAPGMTNLVLLQFVSYGLLFFLTLQVAHSSHRVSVILRGMFIIALAHGLYGIAALTQFGDTLMFMEKWAYLGSATGTFVNRNSFATFLAFGVIVGSASIARNLFPSSGEASNGTSQQAGWLYGIGTAVLLAALIANQSRMGVAAGAFGAMFAVVLVLAKSRLSFSAVIALVVIGAGAAGTMLALFGGGLLERVGSLESSSAVRAALYEQVWEMIMSRPLLGYGAGSFEIAFPLFHQLPVNPDLLWDKAHSTYLSLWAEMGFLVGSIPIIVLVIIVGRLVWLYKNSGSRWFAAAVSLGVLLTSAVHSLVDFSLEMQGVALMFTVIIATGISGGAADRARNGRDV